MTVTAFHEAVQRFLTALALPVYAEVCVPDDACYPYVTWRCSLRAGQEGSLLISGWFRREHIRCLGLADALTTLIPEEPTILAYPGGFAVMHAAELYCQAHAADTSVEACSLRASVHLYNQPKEDGPC